MQVVNSPSLIIRILAVTNFIFAGLGLLLLGFSLLMGGEHGNTSAEPYFAQIFWAMTAMNYMFLGLLILAGVLLWRRKAAGVLICNVVFVAEILYFLAIGYLWGVGTAFSNSVGAATGVGNTGLEPQLICGYPLLGIVFLNIAHKAP
jgi:hypothetical protein